MDYKEHNGALNKNPEVKKNRNGAPPSKEKAPPTSSQPEKEELHMCKGNGTSDCVATSSKNMSKQLRPYRGEEKNIAIHHAARHLSRVNRIDAGTRQVETLGAQVKGSMPPFTSRRASITLRTTRDTSCPDSCAAPGGTRTRHEMRQNCVAVR